MTVDRKPRILVVEDDVDVRRALERLLLREGCDVVTARDGREAMDVLGRTSGIDLVISDLEMPHAGGREVLAAGQAHRVPVVILTGQASVQIAVELMRRGAANFLTKPFSQEALRSVLDDVFKGRADRPPARSGPVMIGKAESLRAVADVVSSVAETDATVLVRGESGTGKEVVARALHAASKRATRPFVAVNCGAIPEALLESELFGHARGAFTGATQSRPGRFQLAEGGTLFLDEIGDMPLAFQVKLLRVLQERQYTPLGDSEPRAADARLIAATHRDLASMVKEGSFREDLYYRINVIEVELPPLRKRKEDIRGLVRHFLDAANARHGRRVLEPGEEVLTLLEHFDWPGNVRQLANVVERMVVLRRTGQLTEADVPAEVRVASSLLRPPSGAPSLPDAGLDLRRTLAEIEDSLISQALERTGGNRNAAAQLLGLNRTTLVEKLKRK